MSQHAFVLDDDDSGTDFVTDVQEAFQALVSTSKGATAPTTKYTGMSWIDDSVTPWLLKRWDGADWITEGEINSTTNKFSPYVDGSAMGTTAKALAAASTAIAARQTIKSLLNSFLTKSAAYTLVVADDGKIVDCNATSAAFTVTLLPAATAGAGYTVAIKKTDDSTNSITIDADGTEKIDGTETLSLSVQYDAVILVSDGTKWRVAAGYRVGTAITGAVNVFTKAQRVTPATNSDASGSVTVDLSDANNHELTLTGNVTTLDASGLGAGQEGCIDLIQDATGGRTVVFSSKFKFPGQETPTVSSGASARDVVAYKVRADGTTIDAILVADFG